MSNGSRSTIGNVLRFLRRLLRAKREQPQPRRAPQGEEYELELAERELRRRGERLGENLIQKAARADNPFVENPFDDAR